ncbi:MAG: hypothetical protein U5K34_08115 [Thiohalophilus sp.]|nr:hypothetical protein [Thiohalophilus sp.]MDZ7803935.1 hypothetical protein [Thiohalophilus sp.]
MAVCKSDSQDAISDFPKTVIPFFTVTVGRVLRNNAARISESDLRF